MLVCEQKLPNGKQCGENAEVWTIEGYANPPKFVLCDKHAAEFGFCLTCGAFIGGTEDCFLTGQDGVCFECYSREQREFDPYLDPELEDDCDFEEED